MTLKSAALLALIGMILVTALLVWNFVFTFLNVLRDLVPAVTLFSSFIYAFGCFGVMVFFFLFHQKRPFPQPQVDDLSGREIRVRGGQPGIPSGHFGGRKGSDFRRTNSLWCLIVMENRILWLGFGT